MDELVQRLETSLDNVSFECQKLFLAYTENNKLIVALYATVGLKLIVLISSF